MLDVTLPARFQWRAYRAVLGQDLPRQSPFDKDQLVWRIMRILPNYLATPEFSELRRYMADDTDQRKLFRSEERRVGKEWKCLLWPRQYKRMHYEVQEWH